MRQIGVSGCLFYFQVAVKAKRGDVTDVKRNKWRQALCEHNRVRRQCKKCGGSGICEHNRQSYHCNECGGFPILAKRMWERAKFRAKRNGLPFNINVEHVLKLIGDGICPVFGKSYVLDSRKSVDASASLDKFIPPLGYIEGNCVVISKKANGIKADATAEEVQIVADWMKRRCSNG